MDWLPVFRSDWGRTDGRTGDVINNLINKYIVIKNNFKYIIIL